MAEEALREHDVSAAWCTPGRRQLHVCVEACGSRLDAHICQPLMDATLAACHMNLAPGLQAYELGMRRLLNYALALEAEVSWHGADGNLWQHSPPFGRPLRLLCACPDSIRMAGPLQSMHKSRSPVCY